MVCFQKLPIALMSPHHLLAGYCLLAWFGPRGIASVLYLLLVVNMLGVEGYERVLSVIVLTVLLSVFLHGVSALPLSQLYGRTSKQAG